jgi:hypothetical protein
MNAGVSLKERVLAAAAAAPSPTRSEGKRRGIWLVILSLAVGIGLFELAGGVAHGSARPLAVSVRLADGWALASSLLTWLALRRKAMLVALPRSLVIATLACPVALFAWMAYFEGAYPPLAGSPPAADWACLLFTLAGAATPLGCFLGLQRGVELQRPDILGAAAGTAAGAWSGVLAILWCPTTSPWHALFGHVVPITLLTCAGSLLGASMLGVRARASPLRPLRHAFGWVPLGRIAMKRAPRAAPSRVSTMIGRM